EPTGPIFGKRTQPNRGKLRSLRRGRLDDDFAPFDYFVTWPRISPPRWSAVWTLAYHFPAMRSAACASVRVAEPFAGLVGLLPIRTATPAFLPGSAGPGQ